MKPGSKARRVTVPAMLSALSLLLLYVSSLVPSGQWGLTALAGLVPAAGVIAQGLWGGCAVWLVTGLLGLLLVPNRLNVLLYLLLFGLYPVVKSLLERGKNKWLALGGKLVFFNGVLTLFVFGISALFLPALPEMLRERVWLLYLAGNAVFLVYDFGFSKLITFYMARMDKNLRK